MVHQFWIVQIFKNGRTMTNSRNNTTFIINSSSNFCKSLAFDNQIKYHDQHYRKRYHNHLDQDQKLFQIFQSNIEFRISIIENFFIFTIQKIWDDTMIIPSKSTCFRSKLDFIPLFLNTSKGCKASTTKTPVFYRHCKSFVIRSKSE